MSKAESAVRIEDLKKISRFNGLSERVLELLVGRFVREKFRKNQIIHREGDPASVFRLIESGAVKMHRFSPSGKEVILNILGVHDVIGEVALFGNEGFPAGALAHESTVTLAMSRQDYLGILDQELTVARAALRSMAEKNMMLSRRIYELGSGDVEVRLGNVLRSLAKRGYFNSTKIKECQGRISRQELADMIGARVETVIRTVKKWEKEGVLRVIKGEIVLSNVDRFETHCSLLG
jgi:CRP/FNR family transcriptional regulator